ncbi:sulfur carrier protein ThiS [Raineyella fluvialis]|uniref:Sulfur carrier protein ThiS n=1 Tax=Raineyella fluvialis TaxID=2662261 RepID=A0A5Q2FCJ3_9ACTN|nr:sulfur carrier protein ThiS [Raineyella fluvialis]QGF24111.1 sulfur carrier protein ThiS [Raineyella fluvialis]
MTATVNGEAYAPRDGETVLDLVAARLGRPLGPDGQPLDGGRLGVAVAVDRAVVPRGSWSRTALADGQHIDIVTAVQGG